MGDRRLLTIHAPVPRALGVPLLEAVQRECAKVGLTTWVHYEPGAPAAPPSIVVMVRED